jgi:hypothetical protein
MVAVLLFSILLGLAWNVLAVSLLGGGLADSLRPGWLLAGAIAGIVTGRFTVWSRQRRDGDESFLAGIATYYLGIAVYWASFVVIERARLCWRAGGWTDFDLDDHLGLIAVFLLYGTLWYGIVLIPLCFLSARLLWALHRRRAA